MPAGRYDYHIPVIVRCRPAAFPFSPTPTPIHIPCVNPDTGLQLFSNNGVSMSVRQDSSNSGGEVQFGVIVSLCLPLVVALVYAVMAKRKSTKKIVTAAVALVVAVVGIIGINNPDATTKVKDVPAQAVVNTPGIYPVTAVSDGDTVKVKVDDKVETIRLIGVDTPETVDPRKQVQCYGKEASDYSKSMLTGKSVGLERDDSQAERDKYGRLLRYIVLPDGSNFNKQLISQGYAFEYTYSTPYKYQADFKAAQLAASNAGLGLWSSETCGGRHGA